MIHGSILKRVDLIRYRSSGQIPLVIKWHAFCNCTRYPLDKNAEVRLRWSSVSIIDRGDMSIVDNSAAHYGYRSIRLLSIGTRFRNRITVNERTIVIAGEGE